MHLLLYVLLDAVETMQQRLSEAHNKADRYKVCIAFMLLLSIQWQVAEMMKACYK